MPPLHPSRAAHGKASKKAACYGCVVTTTIVLSALVLIGLLYAGVVLGVRFREGEVGAVRGADAPIGMLPASARGGRAAGVAPPKAQLDELTDSVSALMSAAGLPLSLPATPSLADLAGAVSAAVPMLQASREAAAKAEVEISAPVSCPACPSVSTAGAPAAGASAAGAAASPRAVIVGMAMNIDVPNLYRFVRSARDHVPGADIVLFVDDDSGDRGAVLRLFSVEVRKSGGTGDTERPRSISPSRLARLQVHRFSKDSLAPAIRAWHPSSYRWVMIRDWMRARSEAGGGPPYDLVMAMDVRDSIFQGDPFAPTGGTRGFWAFQEARPRTVRECGWNSVRAGMEGLLPVDARAATAARPPSRAGLGEGLLRRRGPAARRRRGHLVLRHVRRLVGRHVRLRRPRLGGAGAAGLRAQRRRPGAWGARVGRGSREGSRAGVPLPVPPSCSLWQGIHNYLVYGGDLAAALQQLPGPAGAAAAAVHLVSNEEGWVATVQSMPEVVRDKAGRVLNEKGTPAAVVHQYDRSAQLKEQYDREYVWLPDHVLRLK